MNNVGAVKSAVELLAPAHKVGESHPLLTSLKRAADLLGGLCSGIHSEKGGTVLSPRRAGDRSSIFQWV